MKISVVVTSYNQRAYLREALDSLLTQTLVPFEIIVCDDASTDGSGELIQEYAQRFPGLIQPLIQKENIGVARNRNSGLARAGGEYVTTLDGDDLFAPEKLEKEAETAVKTGAALVYSNLALMDEHTRVTGQRYRGRMRHGDLFEASATLSYPHPREILIRRDCLERVGLQNTTLAVNEDFEWVLRLAGHYGFAPVNQVLVFHRIHEKGLSQRSRLLVLATQRQAVFNLIRLVETGTIPDRGRTLEKLEAFRHLTRAREFDWAGEKAKARGFVLKALAQDPMRSAAWDLWLRLYLVQGMKRPHKTRDTLRLGPLPLPFYLIRGVIK